MVLAVLWSLEYVVPGMIQVLRVLSIVLTSTSSVQYSTWLDIYCMRLCHTV